MRLRKRKLERPGSEIQVSAMIDVVFLLLVYFIVAQTPVFEETHLNASLPSGKGVDHPKPGSVLTIGVAEMPAGKTGEVYLLNQRPVLFEDLKSYLRSVSDCSPESAIVIQCAPEAKHAKLIKILDVCSEYSLSNVNLADK